MYDVVPTVSPVTGGNMLLRNLMVLAIFASFCLSVILGILSFSNPTFTSILQGLNIIVFGFIGSVLALHQIGFIGDDFSWGGKRRIFPPRRDVDKIGGAITGGVVGVFLFVFTLILSISRLQEPFSVAFALIGLLAIPLGLILGAVKGTARIMDRFIGELAMSMMVGMSLFGGFILFGYFSNPDAFTNSAQGDPIGPILGFIGVGGVCGITFGWRGAQRSVKKMLRESKVQEN